MTSTTAPLVGALLGDRYELVRHLARGGTSDVYEAQDTLLRRAVAVKVYRATAPTDRARFDAEVTTLAGLNHPALVQVYDAGEHDGDGYVVLELVDGPTLRSILADRGTLPSDEAVVLGAALADALAYVHEAGVVHRDVTPTNVLCGPDGRPRLADFGIARLLDTTRVTALASAVGTAAYMAPEQLEGRDVTPAADVYALGLVLAEALTGRPAFTGEGHEVALARLVHDPDLGPTPPAWDALLVDMTNRAPEARPRAADVAARLNALAATLAAAAPLVPAAASVGSRHEDVVPEVDPEAVTEVVPTSGGTTVMPVVQRPDRPTPEAGGRSRAWLAVVAVVLLVVLLASQAGGRSVDLPTTPTTLRSIDTSEPVVTTQPPPPTTTTEAPPPDERGEGKDNGRGSKKDDD